MRVEMINPITIGCFFGCLFVITWCLHSIATSLYRNRNSSSSPSSIQRQPKIIQILVTENNEIWQGMLIGLGDDGLVYHQSRGDIWIPFTKQIGEDLPIEWTRISDHNKGE